MDRERKPQEYITFSEELFINSITLAGVRIAEVNDGTNRYAATWVDEYGRNRLSVCGYFGTAGVMFRNVKTNKGATK